MELRSFLQDLIGTAAALVAGLYRIRIPQDSVVAMSRGLFATATSTALDMPMDAGEYYFGVNDGETLSFFPITGLPTISITKV